MSKFKKEKATSPERLVLALIENGHFEESLLLLDQWADKTDIIYLYARALALFATGSRTAEANETLHAAFSQNNYVLPLMVEKINKVSESSKDSKDSKDTEAKSKKQKHTARAMMPKESLSQSKARKYIELWFGSWLQTESAFDWLGNQFVEYTRASKLEKLKAKQEEMLKNMKILDADFFLN